VNTRNTGNEYWELGNGAKMRVCGDWRNMLEFKNKTLDGGVGEDSVVSSLS
jgi:hypothetical protein